MTSMFRRTLATFLFTVLVIVAILALGLFSGYNRSLRAWSGERRGEVERAARALLRAQEGGDGAPAAGVYESTLPRDVPVFVYNRERQLLFSNRGTGRRRDLENMPMFAVENEEGAVVGYFSVGAAQFHTDTANRALVDALVRTVIAAFLAAVGIAAVAAFLLARYLSRPAAQVAGGLDRLADGELDARVPEVGAREIAGIARSANSLAERLQGEQQIRTQWVQDVAHDLRSPVAMIKAQLEAIADGVYRADAPRVGRLLGELNRMEQLINDLDELMRLEAPELRPDVRSFSAAALLESLRERFAVILEDTGVALETQCTASSIAGDENLLYRALSNILANAIRHAGTDSERDEVSPERSVVRCTVERERDNTPVRITVWNGGTPIPPEELPRVFDRLFRGEYARNTRGSGLGLTIARRIVEIHRGEIRVDSGAGVGTTVTIDLPQ